MTLSNTLHISVRKAVTQLRIRSISGMMYFGLGFLLFPILPFDDSDQKIRI